MTFDDRGVDASLGEDRGDRSLAASFESGETLSANAHLDSNTPGGAGDRSKTTREQCYPAYDQDFIGRVRLEHGERYACDMLTILDMSIVLSCVLG